MCPININRDPTCPERLDDDEPYPFKGFTRWYAPSLEFDRKLGRTWVTAFTPPSSLFIPSIYCPLPLFYVRYIGLYNISVQYAAEEGRQYAAEKGCWIATETSDKYN